MIFEQEQVGFTVLDVFLVDDRRVKVSTKKRPFSALSFRLESDAVVTCRGKKHALSGGTVAYFPERVEYEREATEDRILVVHIKNHTYFASEPEFYTPNDEEGIRLLFEKMFAVWEAKEKGYKSLTASVLNEIFARLYAENSPKKHTPPILEELVREMESGFRDPDFVLEALAKRAGISMTYFRRLFKEEYGVSPKQYLLEKRFAYAAALLDAGYYTVAEVALHSGFADAKYFSVQFRKRMGCSPSRYRREE